LKRIDEALEIVGKKGFEDRNPMELSGGQKQRIALAATLTMKPELLILDEPTSQLDPIGTNEVMAALKEIKEKGTTILMTTHKTDKIIGLADKVLILNEGRTVAYGKTEEIIPKVELLKEAGVKAPQVSEYFYNLKEKRNLNDIKIPITVEEATSLLRKLINEKKVEVNKNIEFKEETKKEKEVILEAKNLTYIYPGPPEVVALRNINLKIYEGEFVGIVGQNGSGKTTLVKNFVGLLKPTKGKVLFKGEDIKNMRVSELSKKIGLVLQNPDHQLFTISCRDEIAFGLKNIGVPKEEMEERIREALRLVGLEKEYDTFPFRMSFGDRRKLTVATIIAMRPEVVILDEPTTAQDYLGRYKLADLSRKLQEELGKTVIMISHDIELIAKYVKRLIVMKDGEIILDKPVREALQEVDILKEAFLEPPQITRLALNLKNELPTTGVLTVDEMLKIVS